MRKLFLMLAFIATSLFTANAQVNGYNNVLFAQGSEKVAGVYTGKIIHAYMNKKKDVAYRFQDYVNFELVDRGGGMYALRGILEFQAGPAKHEIDFSDERVTLNTDANGNIISATGKGHIRVSVWKQDWVNSDFTVTVPVGTSYARDGVLNLRLECDVVGGVLGKPYKAIFEFNGNK